MLSRLVTRRSAAAALAVLALVGVAPPTRAASDVEILGAGSGVAVPGRYVVALKDTGSARAGGVAASAGALTGKYGGKVDSVYQRTMSGFSAEMSEAEARRLAADPQVAYVEQDQVVNLADTQENPPSWGLDRIDQRTLPLDTTYSYDVNPVPQVVVYVIDSGIRHTHTEFSAVPARVADGRDFIDNDMTANDCYGHGTRVASIIAGKTYGVAKNFKMHPLRVFNCDGISTATSVQDAVEWITESSVLRSVVNMSLGINCKTGSGQPAPCPPGTATSLKTAITSSIAAGISYVVAAGNHNIDACGSPLNAISGVISVGATTEADARRPDSNWGSCVDLWAPGQGIASAGMDSDTDVDTAIGTSAAAPHVSGALALITDRPGPVKTPAERKAQLLAETTPDVLTGMTVASPNKLLHVSAPPIAGGSSVALARHQDGRLALFGVNRAGALAYRSQTQAGSDAWSAWITSANQNWYSACAETDSAARLKLVGLQRNQGPFHRGQAVVNADSFTIWQQFDGALNSCAVAFDGTKLTVFGTTAEGRVLKRSETAPQGPYTPWSLMLVTPPNVRSVAAERNGNGLVELFGLTRTGQIWHCWQTVTNCFNGVGGSEWVQLDGQLSTIALGRNQSGALSVFGVNAAGQLFRRDAGAGTNTWFNWTQLDVPSTVGTPRSVAAETNADGRITLVVINTAGQIWQRKQTTADGSTYGPWTQIDGQLRP